MLKVHSCDEARGAHLFCDYFSYSLNRGPYSEDIRLFTEYNDMKERERNLPSKENSDWEKGDFLQG
jgi:hypothetical protein